MLQDRNTAEQNVSLSWRENSELEGVRGGILNFTSLKSLTGAATARSSSR